MKLSLRKVGGLKSADVEMNGLTIIAGENDTGKSTVGKMIFAVIKAMAKHEDDLSISKYDSIYELITEFYREIRSKRKIDLELGNLFYPKTFIRDLQPYINNPSFESTEVQSNLFGDTLKVKNINTFFSDLKEIVSQAFSGKAPITTTTLLNYLDKIKDKVIEEKDRTESIKVALSRGLVSEFYNQLIPKHDVKAVSEIKIIEGENVLLRFEIKRNRVTELKIEDEILPFDDVTFIETPILMQMYDVVNQAETLFDLNRKEYGNPRVAFHIKDLISKLQAEPFYFEEENTDIEDIISTMNGGFEFSGEEKDFIFSKKAADGSSMKIKSTNTASGIKSFGMLQLLLQANVVKKNSLLIIDEPETHLHPSWQVKYAEIIVKLVKKDIPVLVTSHSPYMIQALKYYSGKANLGDKLKFYMSEREDEWCKIEDVTDDLNKIFIKLAKPLQQLVWE